jgi:hypothetical protein
VQTTALTVSTHNSNMQKFDGKLRGALARFDQLKRLVDAPHLKSTTHQATLKHQLTVAVTEACHAGVNYDKQAQIGQQLRRASCAGVCLPA